MSLIIQNKNIMKISNNCLVMVFLLLITGCDNKDYTKESPFGNSVYIDAAKVKDIANFTFNNQNLLTKYSKKIDINQEYIICNYKDKK